MSVNKVILVGRLGQDPDVRYMPNETAVCNFSLATSSSYKDKTGEKVDQTEWHRIVMFGKVAEIAKEYLKKGSQIYLEGKLRTRSWDDPQGNKKYTTEVVADTFTMLGRKEDNQNAGNSGTTAYNQPTNITSTSNVANNPVQEEDDLPF